MRRVFTADCAGGAGYRRMHHYIMKVIEDNLGWWYLPSAISLLQGVNPLEKRGFLSRVSGKWLHYRIIEQSGLEGAFKDHQSKHSCNKWRHLHWDEVAQSSPQLDCECFQRQGRYNSTCSSVSPSSSYKNLILSNPSWPCFSLKPFCALWPYQPQEASPVPSLAVRGNEHQEHGSEAV